VGPAGESAYNHGSTARSLDRAAVLFTFIFCMGQLRVRHLGKAYRRYRRKRGRLLEWLGAEPQHELRWVLRDISFEVAPGESVGVVGANGSGKSTLLKLIAGTIQPTAGSVESTGSMAALLELGIGFHPEFTGRENVYMSGSIRGLSPEEIAALLPGIEAFAEIGDYIDQPMRTYSSGMQVRLAFSVATAVRPDILIVDEALSVGDVYFQQKCFDRINAFRANGTTLFFVSHSSQAVYALCPRALYLEDGRLELDGSSKEVIDLYQARIVARSQRATAALEVAAPQAAPSTPEPVAAQAPATSARGATDASTGSYFSEGVTVHSVTLRDASGHITDVFLSDQEMSVEIVGIFDRAVDDPHFGFQVRNPQGQPLFMTTTYGLGGQVGPVAAGDARTVRFRFRPLVAPGEYTITVGIANRGRFDGTFEEALVRRQDVMAFTVLDPVDAANWFGMINLRPTVEVAATPRP
jgi:lipopolysaccharide transport system ATP-binding protein